MLLLTPPSVSTHPGALGAASPLYSPLHTHIHDANACKEQAFQTECHPLNICICDYILFFSIDLGRRLMPRSPQIMPVRVHYPQLPHEAPPAFNAKPTFPHSSHLYMGPKSDPVCPCALSTDEREHAEEHCRLAPSPRSLNEIATVSANTNRARRLEPSQSVQ